MKKAIQNLELELLEVLNGGGFDEFAIEDIDAKIWNAAGLKTNAQRNQYVKKFLEDVEGGK